MVVVPHGPLPGFREKARVEDALPATRAAVEEGVVAGGGVALAQNAGAEGSIVRAKVRESKEKNFGYNAPTEVYEDLVKSGVIDPASDITGESIAVDGGWIRGLL